MSCWVFFRRCSLCKGLATIAIHLTRSLEFPVVPRVPELLPSCGKALSWHRDELYDSGCGPRWTPTCWSLPG